MRQPRGPTPTAPVGPSPIDVRLSPACIAARLTAYAASMNEPKVDQLTASQRDALAAELAELEGPKRTAAVEAIKTAREHGDLSENFEYHAAKDEQGLLEARIRTLRSRLDHSVLVDESELASDKVGVGSTVEIEDDQGNRLQGEISSLGGNGAISPDSPLGRALIGRCQGEAVEVEAPRGRWTARILSIRRT
jgi:transcription elongation factor GreA